MEKKKISNKTTSIATLFSGLGATSAACCAGPGLVGCSTVCAPACGSLTYSLFGISSSAIGSWLGEYWYLFLFISIAFFALAFYKIFISKSNACSRSIKSELIFYVCTVFSISAYIYSMSSC